MRDFSNIEAIPGVCSGRPCISRTMMPTFILAGRFIAGDSIEFLADDFELSVAEVENAIAFANYP